MDNSKLSDLLKIGLTEGEAKVYAALLELGSSTVGPVTKRSGVSYSNIYEILERLLEKGIATFIVKNGVKNFQAVDPINLSKYLDKKQEEVDKQKDLLKIALPRIEALQGINPKQEASLFVGIKGLLAAYNEFLKDSGPDEESIWIYVHDKRYADVSDKFYTENWDVVDGKLKKSRGIGNMLYKNSPFMKIYGKKHEVRFVDFPIFAHGEVFRDRFLLISWEDPIIAVLIKAKHVSDNFREYFEDVWKVARK
jgi:HTH-type transcriptional regulator, sugar sensing transcriptional regulator